jgi:hypothetical protein
MIVLRNKCTINILTRKRKRKRHTLLSNFGITLFQGTQLE